MKVNEYSLSNLSMILQTVDLDKNYSMGRDGGAYQFPVAVYLIVEEIFNILGDRKEILSIKYFSSLDDQLAYDWHTDDTNITESDLTLTAIFYLPGCEGSVLQVKNSDVTDINAVPYKLLLIPKEVQHRAYGTHHKHFLKFTFK
jgi:hypothetical protein